MADELDALLAQQFQQGQTPPTNPSAPAPPDPNGATSTGFMNFLAGGQNAGSIGSVNPNANLWTNDAMAYWGLPLSGGQTPGLTAQRGVAMAARDEKPLDRMATEYRPGAPNMQANADGSTITGKAILESLVRMSAQDRVIVQSKLVASGFLSEKSYKAGAADDATINAMSGLLGEAARYALTRGEVISWQQYLTEKADGSIGAGGEKITEPQRVNLLTVDGVRSSFSASFRQMVGRAPTDAEIANFVDSYNAEARSRPPKESVEIGADGTQFVTTAGGVDPGEFAEEHIQENPDYADYQAVSYYMPALEQALGSIGEGSGGLEL